MADLSDVVVQFEGFRRQLEENNGVRERLRGTVSQLDTVTRQMHSALLPIHTGSQAAVTQALARVKGHLPAVREQYAQLAAIIREHPGEFYRYHDHWRNQTNTVVFLLAFVHWLETGELLSHMDAEKALDLKHDEFGLELEDYLIGLCGVSNELPRYVVNRVTAGDYDCPAKASAFLSELYAGFRILNLRNDFLRKRYDGLKYDLKKVEEVLYDVKIRGLGSGLS